MIFSSRRGALQQTGRPGRWIDRRQGRTPLGELRRAGGRAALRPGAAGLYRHSMPSVPTRQFGRGPHQFPTKGPFELDSLGGDIGTLGDLLERGAGITWFGEGFGCGQDDAPPEPGLAGLAGGQLPTVQDASSRTPAFRY